MRRGGGSMKTAFLLISLLLFLSLATGTVKLYKLPNRFVRERFVAIGAILMSLYIIFCFGALFFAKQDAKLVLLFCAISPFLIGRCAVYKYLQVFTVLQLLVIAGGMVYVYVHGII